MPKDLKELSDRQDDLLLAEVGAWLHMIGKYQRQFLIEDSKALDEKLPLEIYPDRDNSCYLGRFQKLNEIFQFMWNAPFGDEKYSFLNMTEHHRKPEKAKTFIEKLLFDAHGRGSAIDKGNLLDISFKNQEGDNFFLASAFGWEKKAIVLDDIETNRKKFYEILQEELIKIQRGQWIHQNWESWRNSFLKRLKENFSQIIADTRLPINDVSLWDQTASTVAFFKVLLADAILGDKDKKKENRLNDHVQFRVLQVIAGGMDYLIQSARIANFQKRKEIISTKFDQIKTLLEVKYPLGYEIYRDVDRIAFLVPDITDLLKVTDSCCSKSLELMINEHFHEVGNGEIENNKIQLSAMGTRNIFYVGNQLKELAGRYNPTLELLQKSWKEQIGLPLNRCAVCQIRPESGKNKSYKVCEFCMDDLQGRCENWVKKQDPTIWLDEVADENGRVALVVGKFDLSRWQNGEMISTCKNISNISVKNYNELVRNFKKSDGSPLGTVAGLKEVLRKEWRTLTIGNMKKYMIIGEDLENYQLSEEEKLALYFWRKPPSFPRISRVWNTTQTFWWEIVKDLSQTVESRSSRIKVSIKDELKDLSEYNTYIAETSTGLRFTVVHAEQRTLYIGENLRWLAKKMGARSDEIPGYGEAADYVCQKLRQTEGIRFYAFETMNQSIGQLQREQFDISREDEEYLPAIEILAEPEHFMAFVPADKALVVAEAIRSKFCLEMGKVRNRLPFNLGLVFAPSHTPLTALLDAGRRMINIKTETEGWVLKEKEKIPPSTDQTNAEKRIVESYRLTFDNGQVWEIPALMGDQATADIWHPNFCVSQDKGGQEPSARPTAFKGPDGWLVHVSELEAGDKVQVIPARFDFEFLDSAARRFEISYYEDQGKPCRLGDERQSRPYYLDQLSRFEELKTIIVRHFYKSQIYQIVQLIESKRIEWEQKESVTATFEQFVEETFRNAQWKRRGTEETLEQIVNTAVSGELRDVLELYFQILKCDFEGERM